MEYTGKFSVATVPTACGIETGTRFFDWWRNFRLVATVPTACGIETLYDRLEL